MIKYYNSIVDDNGYIHSIDNVIVTYYLKCSVNKCIELIREIKDKFGSDNYWERLNAPACQKWSWYQNHIHLEDGIYISIGRYSDYDKNLKKWFIFDMMKVEVNPNKHFDKIIFQGFLDFIREWTGGGYLNKHDYAIDVPVMPSMVKVYGSRKEPGLHKGTRYWGQRNKHGYLKIYDKQKESALESPLTRIEHTLCTNEPLSFENVYIVKINDIEHDLSELSGVNRVIVEMCHALMSKGEDIEEYLKDLDSRKRKKLEPFIVGRSEQLRYNECIHKQLLEHIYEIFDLNDDAKSKNDNLLVDDDGFVSMSSNPDLIFV